MQVEVVDGFLEHAAEKIVPAIVVHVYHQGQTVYRRATGWLDPETRLTPAGADTLFDLASLTKLVTLTAFLRLVERRNVAIDQAVAEVLPAFSGQRVIAPYEDPLRPGAFVTVDAQGGTVDAGAVTFRHLLTHSSGLPAWRPFYRRRPEEIEDAVLGSSFAYRPGQRIVYSDLGFILLGIAIVALTSCPLQLAVKQLVFDVLGQSGMQFGPVPAAAAAPTEECPWRGRRLQGEVHDENAWAMGGAAGHAGLFGTASAMAALGQAWLSDCTGARRLLPQSLAAEATSLQAEDGTLRRGLGWALWSPDPQSPGNPFSRRTFGHTGFTGTSLYVDPRRDLVVACLTNEVYRGRQARQIAPLRTALHRQVLEAL